MSGVGQLPLSSSSASSSSARTHELRSPKSSDTAPIPAFIRRKDLLAERRLTIDNIKSFLEPDSNLELLVEDGETRRSKIFKSCIVGMCYFCIGISQSFLGPVIEYLGDNAELGLDDAMDKEHKGEGGGVSDFAELKMLAFLFTVQFFGFGVGSLCASKKVINSERGAIGLSIALIMTGMCLIFLPIVSNIWGLYGLMLLIGFGGGVVDAGGFILLDRIWRNQDTTGQAKIFRAAQMEKMRDATLHFSIMHLFFAAGGLVASVVVLAVAMVVHPENHNYNWYLEGIGLFILLFAVLLFFLRLPHEHYDYALLTDEEDKAPLTGSPTLHTTQLPLQQQQQHDNEKEKVEEEITSEKGNSRYGKGKKAIASLQMQRIDRQLLVTLMICFFCSFGGLVTFGGWLYIFGRNHLDYQQSWATFFSCIFWLSLLLGRVAVYLLRRFAASSALLGDNLLMMTGAFGAIFGSLIMIIWVDDNRWVIAIGAVVVGASISVFHTCLYGLLLDAQVEAYYSSSLVSVWPTVERAACRISSCLGAMFMPVMVALMAAEESNAFWEGWNVLAWVTMGAFGFVLVTLTCHQILLAWQKLISATSAATKARTSPTLSSIQRSYEEEEEERRAFLRAKKQHEEERRIKAIYCAHEGSFIEDDEEGGEKEDEVAPSRWVPYSVTSTARHESGLIN